MIVDMLIYFVIFAAICVAAPIVGFFLYGILYLFPKTRQLLKELEESEPTAA